MCNLKYLASIQYKLPASEFIHLPEEINPICKFLSSVYNCACLKDLLVFITLNALITQSFRCSEFSSPASIGVPKDSLPALA